MPNPIDGVRLDPPRLGIIAAMERRACCLCFEPLTTDVDTSARDVSGPVPFGTVDGVTVHACGPCVRRIRRARERGAA